MSAASRTTSASARRGIEGVSKRAGRYHPVPAAASRARLALVAHLAAAGQWRALGPVLRRAECECGPRRVEEALLQLVLFCGYPTAIEAFKLWGEVRSGPARSSAGHGGRPRHRRDGERLCSRVYGSTYPRLRSEMKRLSPELDGLIVEVGYGRVLSRPGLPPAARELVTVGALLASGRGRQLAAHVLGALRVGVAETELRSLVRQLAKRDAAARSGGVEVRKLLDTRNARKGKER